MKIVVPSTCVVAGIAIGWFAHPLLQPADKLASAEGKSAPAPESGNAHAGERSASVAPTEDRGSKTRLAERSTEKKPNDAPKIQEASEAAKKAQKQMADRMIDTQRKRFETRLAKLAGELNLTAEQQQQVRDKMEKYLTSYGSIFSMDGSDDAATKMQETMELMKKDGVDESLSGVLQGDQIAKYQEVKAKDLQTRADAKALKSLSNLSTSVDDLTQTQKDAIYQAYTDEAMKSEGKPLNSISQMYEGMGVQIDDELGFQDFMQGKMEEQLTAGKSDGMADPKDWRSTMKQMVDQKIESKLATLKPILNEAQLQQYRTHLEDKASGMLNMFGGAGPDEDAADDGHGHDTYQVVPKSK